MPPKASPGSREERVVALYLRLLAEGCPVDAWVPLKHARNAVAATTQISSKSGVRNHLARAEDMGLMERRRHGNAWYIRLRPLGHPEQFIPCLELDTARELVPEQAHA